MDPTKFPFDTQKCSIAIGSWQYDKARINLTARLEKNYFRDSTPSQIWSFVSMSVSDLYTSFRSPNSDDSTDGNNATFQSNDIYFNLIISRKSSYYMLNNIYPCFILNLVSLLAFFLPYASQLTISMSIFLTLAIYSLRVASDMPISSGNVPWISYYFLLGILYTFAALIWFVIANHLSTNNYLPTFMISIAKVLKGKEKSKKIKPIQVTEVVKNEMKPSCNKCEMCESCKANKVKEDDKKKEKSNFESYLSIINMMIFSLLLMLVTTSNLIVWFAASSS